MDTATPDLPAAVASPSDDAPVASPSDEAPAARRRPSRGRRGRGGAPRGSERSGVGPAADVVAVVGAVEVALAAGEVTIADAERLRRRTQHLLRQSDPARAGQDAARLQASLEHAQRRLTSRKDAVPRITYPPDLPVSARRDDLLAAVRDHQVVIVAGETGSGKTTQLPKVCLEAGRGVRGAIAHTQPRRIAARSVAERIAEELRIDLGAAVGYTVRFHDQSSRDTLVRLMTDGVLLAEIGSDPMLTRYDTVIIDEAHERSLNIDFLLGYLKQLLPRRPDLKLVITSATIDPQRFSAHFDDAPIVEVSGRTYPVEVRYRPLVDDLSTVEDDELEGLDDDEDDERDGDARATARTHGKAGRTERAAQRRRDARGIVNRPASQAPGRGGDQEPKDQVSGIVEAVEELSLEGPGDILVFCSGEREIRDAADALAGIDLPGPQPVDVLPLYARLSAAEQHRVFAQHPGRRIVLATNVAETSLTVPGIRYVVDPGTARISRYSHRTKVQRLPIEPVSQASANQRAGRCGRVAEGICIRLYSPADFESRPEFTDPEILRTHLASVILQMAALGLGDVEAFPFVEPPDKRSVRDGVQLLEELGALDTSGEGLPRLTPLGRRLAQIPIDPRLARMLLEAEKNGCVREVTVIAAALSIQDPRERPSEEKDKADAAHSRFADGDSDFLSFLRLWRYLRSEQRARSSNQFRKMCRTEYLNYLRVREWQDLVAQLKQVLKTQDVSWNEPLDLGGAERERIAVSLLAGLLSHVGMRDVEAAGAGQGSGGPGGRRSRADRRPEYVGARGARFSIAPGSALLRPGTADRDDAEGVEAKGAPRWVMAAELVETSRLFARTAARIDPDWIEPVAGHLVQRTFSEPRWDRRRAAVLATERVTLYGIPIVAARTVTYGKVDPELSRELFLRHALVEGEWDTRHHFFRDNRALIAEVEELEDRARRRDLLVDDETLFAFYDARVPADVVSGRHFDAWWKKARHVTPDLLTLTRDLLLAGDTGLPQADLFPDTWTVDGRELVVSYRFEPGHSDDGVSVEIPLANLPSISGTPFGWQVPGLREEVVTALIRSLPKVLRRSFVPAPDHAARVAKRLAEQVAADPTLPEHESITEAVRRELTAMGGPVLALADFDPEKIPEHLRPVFVITDTGKGGGSKIAGKGRDLELLRRHLAPKARTAIVARLGAAAPTRARPAIERDRLDDWTANDLPVIPHELGEGVKGFPALVDEGDHAALRVLATADEQRRAMPLGVRRLLVTTLPSPVRGVVAGLPGPVKLGLGAAPHASPQAVFADAIDAAVDALVVRHAGPRGVEGATWDAAWFARLREAVRADLHDAVTDTLKATSAVLSAYVSVNRQVTSITSLPLLASLADVKQQVAALVYPGFVTATGAGRLPDVVRYLKAAQVRLEKLPERAVRDRDLMGQVQRLQADYDAALDAALPGRRRDAEVREIRWMLEELRVSLFAQTLRTAYPVSEKRVRQAIASALG